MDLYENRGGSSWKFMVRKYSQTSWELEGQKAARFSIFLSLGHMVPGLCFSLHIYPFSLPASIAQTGILLSFNFSLHVALLVTVLVHTYSDVAASLPTVTNHSFLVS